MATTTETLSLGIDTNGFISGLRQAGRAVNRFESQMKTVGKTVAAVGAGLTATITLPLTLLGKSAIRAGSDAEETASKFSVVFKGISSDANRAVNSLVNDYDLAGTEAKRLLSNTGDLLTGFGFARDEALKLSSQVNTLAVDLASFTNIEGGTKRASEALTKALLGEAESAKLLGIVINQNSDQYKTIYKEISRNQSLTQSQVKAYTALKIAVTQSQNAIGDYARTRQQLANSERAFGQQLINLREEIGKILIQTLKLDKVYAFLRDTTKQLVSWLKGLSSSSKTALVVFGGLIAAAGPLLIALGGIVALIPSIVAGFTALGSISLPLIGTIAGVTASITALGAVAVSQFDMISNAAMTLWSDISNSFNGVDVNIKTLGNAAKWLWDIFNTYVAPIGGVIIVGFIAQIRSAVNITRIGWNIISGAVRGAVALILNNITLLLDGLSTVTDRFDGIRDSIKLVRDEMSKAAFGDLKDIGQAGGNLFDSSLMTSKAALSAIKGESFSVFKNGVKASKSIAKNLATSQGGANSISPVSGGISQDTAQLGAFQKGSAEEFRIRSGTNTVQQTIADNSNKQVEIARTNTSILNTIAGNTKFNATEGVINP